MLGPRAAVARIPHQVQNGCRRSNAHLAGQDPPRPWPTPMAPMDGPNGTEASDCVAVPPVRLCDRPSRRATAVDRVLGSAARCGGRRRAINMRRSSRRAIARSPKNQSNSRAVERTCTLVVRAGSGAREPGAQSLASARAGGGCSVRAPFCRRSAFLEERLTSPRPQDRVSRCGLHTAAERIQPAEQEQRPGEGGGVRLFRDAQRLRCVVPRIYVCLSQAVCSLI